MSRLWRAVVFLPGLLVMAALQAAPPPLPVHGVARDAESGAVLYRERWTSVFDGDAVSFVEIVYYAPDGERLGRKTLDFGDNPRQPAVGLKLRDGGLYRLENSAGRWVATRREGADEREKQSWPRLRKDTLVDEALWIHLIARQEAALAGELTELRQARLLDPRQRSYRLERRPPVIELLRPRLIGDDELHARLWFEPASGRLRGWEGPPALPGLDVQRVRVEFRE